MTVSAPLRSRALLLAVILLTLSWLWLSSGQTVVAAADAGMDDALFVRQSTHLATGHWLGPYDELTLAKGPGHPLFLAFSIVLGISVPLAQRLLYAAACLGAAWALSPLLRGRFWGVTVYAALLFQPVASRNLTREGIYPALSLAVVSLAVALLLRPEAPPRQVALLAGALGGVLGAFWITREEGIWIAPPLVLAAVALAFAWLRRYGARRESVLRLVALGAAPAAWGAVLLAVSLANLAAYGVATRVEVVASPFADAYGALSRIRTRERHPFIPVPREAREAAYAASPAFRELRGLLDGPLGAQWRGVSCGELPEACADLAGGWFQWALRGATARVGHHRTATDARDFYARVAREVNEACATGALSCGPPRATISPVDAPATLLKVLADPVTTLEGAASTLMELDHVLSDRRSTGSEEGIALFADVASSRLAPTADVHVVSVRGWAFAVSGEQVEPSLESSGRPAPGMIVRRSPSPDIAAIFEGPSRDYARFEVRGPCEEPCAFVLRSRGAIVARGPVPRGGGFRPVAADGIEVWVDDVVRPGESSLASPRAALDRLERAVVRRMGRVFRRVLPAASALAILAAAAGFGLAVRRRGNILPAVAVAVVASSVVARVVLVWVIHLTSFPAVRLAYLSPAFPLAVLFVAVGLLIFAAEIRRTT